MQLKFSPLTHRKRWIFPRSKVAEFSNPHPVQVVELPDSGHAPLDRRVNIAELIQDVSSDEMWAFFYPKMVFFLCYPFWPKMDGENNGKPYENL